MGEPRLTGDVDLTILTGFGQETAYIEQLCRAYPGRIADAAEFAHRTRVLLLQSARGIPIDISLGALPFEQRVIERSTFHQFLPEALLNTCSAEDLIALKAFGCGSFATTTQGVRRPEREQAFTQSDGCCTQRSSGEMPVGRKLLQRRRQDCRCWVLG